MTNLDLLTQINLDDLVAAFGWKGLPARMLRRVFFSPAQKFATHMLDFDSDVGDCGLPAAARRLNDIYTRGLRVVDSQFIPDSGFLALSNHPGMTDTLALFAALQRPDLRIIALDRPFLQALPNVSERLFYVKEDSAARVGLMRQVSAHLKNGGAALTFPAGHIEPDPDVYPGAVDSLAAWTDSVGVFIRLSPHTPILPVLVRGVVWEQAAKHPLLKIKRTRAEKEKLAAALQLLSLVIFARKPVTVTVQIGRPITAAGLGTTETAVIHQAVLNEMKRLIRGDRS